ncbi:MAG: exodeoxyribonuclease VII small subunit [Eubacterium sp.]|nr:exodeoxyribonuclease VII small subunit [Eubacterium sp.]
MSDKEEMTLEEALASIENIIREMSGNDITLEDSFSDYQKGIELVKYCRDSIDRVEKELQVLDPRAVLADGEEE